MLVVASLGWGVSTTLSAFALRQIGPTDLLAIELVSGGLVICGAALWGTLQDSASARHSFATPDWRAFALLGLCEPGVTYLLANEGLRRDSAATAALLFATEAIIVVPLAAVFLTERVSPGVFWAIGVGLLGAIVIAGGAHAGRDTLAGHLLILASSAAAATYALLARHSTHRAPALVVTTYQLLAAAAIAVPYAIVSHAVGLGGGPGADLSHWAAAIAAGLAGVALPFLLYNRAIVEIRATVAAGVLNLVPLVRVRHRGHLSGRSTHPPQDDGRRPDPRQRRVACPQRDQGPDHIDSAHVPRRFPQTYRASRASAGPPWRGLTSSRWPASGPPRWGSKS